MLFGSFIVYWKNRNPLLSLNLCYILSLLHKYEMFLVTKGSMWFTEKVVCNWMERSGLQFRPPPHFSVSLGKALNLNL